MFGPAVVGAAAVIAANVCLRPMGRALNGRRTLPGPRATKCLISGPIRQSDRHPTENDSVPWTSKIALYSALEMLIRVTGR